MFSNYRELKRAIRYKLISNKYRFGKHPEVRNAPFVENAAMIFMPGRSGGTLMLRLLDGHEELAVRPANLTTFGFLHKTEKNLMWPEVDHSDHWQFDLRWDQWAAGNYDKKWANPSIDNRHKITINPAVHYAVWKAKNGHPFLRDSEAFFAAWEEYEKRNSTLCVFHITPKNPNAKSFDRFFNDFPNGRIISVIRNPLSWGASHLRLPKSTSTLEDLCKFYSRFYSQAPIKDERFMLIRFEDLVANPEGTTKRIAKFMGVKWQDSMMSPTLNGVQVVSNSSFEGASGIDVSALDRLEHLSVGEKKKLSELMPLYDELGHL